ncbi:MAG: flagellar hook-length control protein [Armatimonadota bacterium]|nr:MAG: flagellar hook-length control protein [Armatimonadota bacterium]
MTTPSPAATFLAPSAGAAQPGALQSAGQDAASGGFLQALAIAALADGLDLETGEQSLPVPVEQKPPDPCGKDQVVSEADASAIPPAAPVSLITAQAVLPMPEEPQPGGMPGSAGPRISAVHQEPAGRNVTPPQGVRLVDSPAGEEISGEQSPRENRPSTGIPQDPREPMATDGTAGERQSPLPASGVSAGVASLRSGQHSPTEDLADHLAPLEPAKITKGQQVEQVAAVLPDVPEAAPVPDVAKTAEMQSVAVSTAPQSRMRIRESGNDRAHSVLLSGHLHARNAAEASAPGTGAFDSEVLTTLAPTVPDVGPIQPEAAFPLGPAARDAAANEPASPALQGTTVKDAPSENVVFQEDQRPTVTRPAAVSAGEAEGSHQFLAEHGDHLNPVRLGPVREERSERPASSGAEVTASEAHAAADALRNLREATGSAQAAPPERRAPEVVDPPRLVDQVVRAVELTRRGAATDLTVQLDPPELGVLRVKVTLSDGAITAHVRADLPDVHRLLLTGQSELRDALQQAGLRVDEIRVPPFGSGFADPGRQSQPRQEHARPRRASSAASLEGVRSAAAFAGMAWLARTDSRALVDRFA